MPAPRRLSPTELALEYFYSRTYRAQYVLRIGTIGLVAAACLHFDLLSPLLAGLWVVAFLACELVIWAWWRRIAPRLGTLDLSTARRRQREMIFFCALSTSAAAAPFFVNPAPSTAAAVVSVLFCAGVLMLIAAQQSMTRNMFLWTAPLPALAMIRNMMLLGNGEPPLIMAALAFCFVVNARQLQLSNARAEARMVRGQADAQRDNDAKREFLATVSHEIRTPLNGVLGMAEAMAGDTLSPAQAERLDVVRRSGHALQTLLNDMLDLSKIEAGKLELEIGPFDLAQAVTAAAEPFLASARGKGLRLHVDVADIRGHFAGDANRTRQIVTNLVSNSVKFTERGEVTVRGRRVGNGVELEVRDTGIGMSPDALDRVFDRFAQADPGVAGRYGGTGLGLSICRDLAALMGGRIEATSQAGAGSRFRLFLPLPSAAAPQATGAALHARPAAADLSALRILVAEDNPTNQLVLQHLLGAFGDVALTMVEHGRAALEAYEREPWDLVLMDINMPVLDGVGATVEIRAHERAAGRPRVPILALTANAMSHQVSGYLAAGLDGVVAKPVSAGQLLAAITAAMAAPETAEAEREGPAAAPAGGRW
jgi:signal transduction histidine kinase/CheY-like chemotaxis protein